MRSGSERKWGMAVAVLLAACGSAKGTSGLAEDEGEPAYQLSGGGGDEHGGVAIEIPDSMAFDDESAADAGEALPFIDVGTSPASEDPSTGADDPADDPAEAPLPGPGEADPGASSDDPAPADTPPAGPADAPPEAEPPADAPPPDAPPPEDPFPAVDLTGTWSGSYDCLQGATALTLEVQHDLFDDTLRAEFAFGPSRQNPDVPTGRYTMEGEFMSLFGSVSLFPTGWIEQPEGYGMVGLEATYDVFGDTLTGYIDAADCGDLSLQRVQ